MSMGKAIGLRHQNESTALCSLVKKGFIVLSYATVNKNERIDKCKMVTLFWVFLQEPNVCPSRIFYCNQAIGQRLPQTMWKKQHINQEALPPTTLYL